KDRPVLALERLHRGIVIDGNDEDVGLLGCPIEITNVADVQDVEAAVGERDGASRRAVSAHELDARLAREDLTHARDSSPWAGSSRTRHRRLSQRVSIHPPRLS